MTDGEGLNPFRAVGFAIDSEVDVVRLAADLAPGSPFVQRRDGFLLTSSIGRFLRVSIGVTSDRKKTLGIRPYFLGQTSIAIEGKGLEPTPRTPMEGIFWGVVPDPEGKQYPLMAALDDIEGFAAGVRPNEMIRIHLCAFVFDVRCYPDRGSFLEAKPGPIFPAFAALGWKELDERRRRSPSVKVPAERNHATALLSATVREAEVLTNARSGLPFEHLVVDIRSGSVDVVAEPDTFGTIPSPGNVIHGRFLLSATRVQSNAGQ